MKLEEVEIAQLQLQTFNILKTFIQCSNDIMASFRDGTPRDFRYIKAEEMTDLLAMYFQKIQLIEMIKDGRRAINGNGYMKT